MKKVLVVLMALLLVVSSNLFAQEKTAKGQIELGGNAGLSFSSASFDGDKIWSETFITLYPRIGFFVVDKLEIEPQLILESYTLKPEGGDSETMSHFGGIFSISYNFEGSSNLIPFIFAGIGFKANSITDAEDLKTTMILPDVGAGLKAFISDKCALRTEVFYSRMTNGGLLGLGGITGAEDVSNNTFGLRAGFSLFLK